MVMCVIAQKNSIMSYYILISIYRVKTRFNTLQIVERNTFFRFVNIYLSIFI